MLDVENVKVDFDVNNLAEKIYKHTIDMFIWELRRFVVFTVVYMLISIGVVAILDAWVCSLTPTWRAFTLVFVISALAFFFPLWCYTVTETGLTSLIHAKQFIERYDHIDAKTYVIEGIDNGYAWSVVPGSLFVKLLLQGVEITSIRLSKDNTLSIQTCNNSVEYGVHIPNRKRISNPVTLCVTDDSFYIECDLDNEPVGIKPTITYTSKQWEVAR